jgi:hypothetical protein
VLAAVSFSTLRRPIVACSDRLPFKKWVRATPRDLEKCHAVVSSE